MEAGNSSAQQFIVALHLQNQVVEVLDLEHRVVAVCLLCFFSRLQLLYKPGFSSRVLAPNFVIRLGRLWPMLRPHS